jgi:hypothetical protein
MRGKGTPMRDPRQIRITDEGATEDAHTDNVERATC